MGRNGGARGAGREQGVGDEQTVHDAQGAQEDRALMRRIAEGDVSAFVTLYHRYRRSMFTYFYRRLADRWGAEDLVQELFMRVLRAADRYDPVQPFAAWLQAMATNLAHDAYRRRATRPEETALTELLEQEQAAAGRAGRAKRVIRTTWSCVGWTPNACGTRCGGCRPGIVRSWRSGCTPTARSARSPRGWASQRARPAGACTRRSSSCGGRCWAISVRATAITPATRAKPEPADDVGEAWGEASGTGRGAGRNSANGGSWAGRA